MRSTTMYLLFKLIRRRDILSPSNLICSRDRGTFIFVTVTNIYIYIYVCVCVFVLPKSSGYASHLSDHRPKVEVVIIPPKMNLHVQPVDTGVTTNNKPIICARIFFACIGGSYGMRCKCKKKQIFRKCIFYT
jgi:hypothetical protein